VQLADVDLSAETWGREVPHEMFRLLREEAPVWRHPEADGPGYWAVTKYDDVVAISRDAETWSTELGSTFISDFDEEGLEQVRLTLLNMDPPKHTRYRMLVNRGFTPRMIGNLHDAIRERARLIVDGVVERGECEFINDVACELPLQVICDMIGVPEADRRQIFEWSNKLVGFDDPELQSTPEDGEIAAAEIYAYCDAIAGERRKNPRDDIMSTLVHAEVDGERLSDLELNLFFVLLAVAGNETTRNLIAHSILALIEHPDARAELVADPSLMPVATEEMLRWGCSIQNFRRTATTDTEIRGVPIPAGDKAVIYYLSANRDPDAFDAPDTFDIRRDPNHHVAFGGGGVHFCLGANLARLEIRVMVEEVIRRMPDMELAGPYRRMRSDFINGITSMPVSFTPQRAAAAS
jgi:cholest-4-en-3-one 26-monooxygenase